MGGGGIITPVEPPFTSTLFTPLVSKLRYWITIKNNQNQSNKHAKRQANRKIKIERKSV